MHTHNTLHNTTHCNNITELCVDSAYPQYRVQQINSKGLSRRPQQINNTGLNKSILKGSQEEISISTIQGSKPYPVDSTIYTIYQYTHYTKPSQTQNGSSNFPQIICAAKWLLCSIQVRPPKQQRRRPLPPLLYGIHPSSMIWRLRVISMEATSDKHGNSI